MVSDDPALRTAMEDPTYSEGPRIFPAERTVSFAMNQPLTGSGHRGAWILPELDVASRGLIALGSAHNQCLGVLFITGVVGVCRLHRTPVAGDDASV